MKFLRTLCLLPAARPLTAVTALAVDNPFTGDNSIIPLALGGMGVAAVVLIVVMVLTRNKK